MASKIGTCLLLKSPIYSLLVHECLGLIRWRIVIHGFIDGYSRLVTGLRASNNNRSTTVLDVFLCAAQRYNVPSRVRGDHGTENLLVAEYMERTKGVNRGSYIWGRCVLLSDLPYCSNSADLRSVHNVRIERLWLNVTQSFGAKWYDFFNKLEFRFGLDINCENHIWLLHLLFLPSINRDVALFVETWNNHRIQIRHGTGRSPIDMYGFDMLAHGLRGDLYVDPGDVDMLLPDDIETFGVDWAGLHDAEIRRSHQANNPISEGTTTWRGRSGPPDPEMLSNVDVDPPIGILGEAEVELLRQLVSPTMGLFDEETLIQRWRQGLAFAMAVHPDFSPL